MGEFEDIYKRLNQAQRQAVDTLDGPVLVIAGPGTGKTQLLSARVANILKRTDTPAQNILCLTFTDSGAANMRQRLSSFIGQSAYDVTIGTYHSFGGDLIRRYPEYFNELRLQTPIDDLTKRQIMTGIVEAMGYDNPLKQSRHHIADLMVSISEIKRALLSSRQLQAIAAENLLFISQGSNKIGEIFMDFKSMTGIKKALPLFETTLVALQSLTSPETSSSLFGSLASMATNELARALRDAEALGKTTPLTVWKNNWLAKDADNKFIIAGELENHRLIAMAEVLETYQAKLAETGLYDFDDMIIRAIEVLENNQDLKYTLQEKYLYILLDEFQDTNASQLKLIQLLTDNPVNEGRPNILAVGDDDQAIYAFQGAQYSNMLDFVKMFHGVKIINLTENYRSHADILHTAHNVAMQIDSRLDKQFDDMSKVLTAANSALPNAEIERVSFKSEVAERDWVAGRIETLISDGVPLNEIAVLAPKHKYLEPLVPYLNAREIPVRYEKRENILDSEIVKQLVSMSRLVIALSEGNSDAADALWPEVLSYDFWDIPVDKIWRTSWQVRDSKDPTLDWSKALLGSEETVFRLPVLLFLSVTNKISLESCETILDYLIGTLPLKTHDSELPSVRSPLRDHYSNPQLQAEKPELFVSTISHLAVLRAKLREYQNAADSALLLPDFVNFIDMYEAAEQKIMNTSPYNQQADSVQLMTAYKAKGLEYEHVFLIHCEDAVWGSSARGNSNKLTIPANLRPIRPAGGTEDEKLRLLFVAITRAKYGLHLSNSEQTYTGRRSTSLKYFDEQEQPDDTIATMILPEVARTVQTDDGSPPSVELLQLDWQTKHIEQLTEISLKSMLSERLDSYQLSPSHVVSFIDLEYSGPRTFFVNTILNFPQAPTTSSQFGIAIHETLEWVQHRVSESEYMPSTAEVIEHFKQQIIAKKFPDAQALIEIERGSKALKLWLKQRLQIFAVPAVVERSFRGENVLVGEASLTGRIDRMEIDERAKTITVVDYKTGKSYNSWKSDSKLLKNRLQLYYYKMLIEGSRTYKGYHVTSGRLEFVEPDDFGRVNTLEIKFDDAEQAEAKKLLEAVWRHVKELDFPDTGQYAATLTGIRKFEQDLVDGTV